MREVQPAAQAGLDDRDEVGDGAPDVSARRGARGSVLMPGVVTYATVGYGSVGFASPRRCRDAAAAAVGPRARGTVGPRPARGCPDLTGDDRASRRGGPVGWRDVVYGAYERRVLKDLPKEALPRHVAVMLDGNRRWARARGAGTASGHQAGADKIEELLEWCRDAGVEYVTLWLLSTDNLRRAEEELAPLLKIIETAVADLAESGHWHLKIVGALDLLPPETAASLSASAERTQDVDGHDRQRRRRLRRAPRDRRRRARPAARPGRRTASRSSRSPPASRSRTSPGTSTPRASPTPTSSSARRASSGSAASCSGRARRRSSTSARPTGRTSATSTSSAP